LDHDDVELGWRAELDAYCGPLDLLLYLIKTSEVDVYDIPIARITEQYLQYLDVLRTININLAGEFLVMAATLMEVKSKMLLPREEVTFDEIEDPRLELVRQLLEYKKIKDAARELDARAGLRDLKFGRPFERIAALDLGEAEGVPDEADLPEGVSLWDLVSAFAKVLQETRLPEPHTIQHDERPLRQYRIDLLGLLRELGQVRFTAIFEDLADRVAIITTFLALLELIRSRRARVQQAEEFGEIVIILGELGHVDIPETALSELEKAPEERLGRENAPSQAEEAQRDAGTEAQSEEDEAAPAPLPEQSPAEPPAPRDEAPRPLAETAEPQPPPPATEPQPPQP
jgi:segregation and condensation protein A